MNPNRTTSDPGCRVFTSFTRVLPRGLAVCLASLLVVSCASFVFAEAQEPAVPAAAPAATESAPAAGEAPVSRSCGRPAPAPAEAEAAAPSRNSASSASRNSGPNSDSH